MPNLIVGENTWATEAQANEYLDASVSAISWEAFDTDQRARALVSAFRILSRADFDPSKFVLGQTDPVPANIINAQIEYAALIAADPTLVSAVTGDQQAGTKALGAGSARIEFFNNNPNAQIAGSRRYPSAVHELITPCLAGNGAGAGAALFGGVVSGNEDESSFTGNPKSLTRGFA